VGGAAQPIRPGRSPFQKVAPTRPGLGLEIGVSFDCLEHMHPCMQRSRTEALLLDQDPFNLSGFIFSNEAEERDPERK